MQSHPSSIMGWTPIQASEKRIRFPTHWVPPKGTAKVVFSTIDLFAHFRQRIPPTLGSDVTPRTAVNMWWAQTIAKFRANYYYISSDVGEWVPEFRVEHFYVNKRYRPATEDEIAELTADHNAGRRLDEALSPVTGRIHKTSEMPCSSEEAQQITPDHMPCCWRSAWDSPSAKRALWTAIETCLIDKATGLSSDSIFVFRRQTGERVQVPMSVGPIPQPLSGYGEGDTDSVHAAAWCSNYFGTEDRPAQGLLFTNDGDVWLNLVLIQSPGTSILTQRAFCHIDKSTSRHPYTQDTVALTMGSARKKWGSAYESGNEVLDYSGIYNQPHLISISHRYTWVFLLLCCAGVDYCDGLSRWWGWKHISTVETAFRRGGFPPFVTAIFDKQRPLTRALRVDLNSFVAAIGTLPSKKPVNLAEFTKELHSIIFTIRLFAGFDAARRPRAGPPIPDFTDELFPGAESLADVFQRKDWPPLLYVETHSLQEPDQLLHAPALSYGATQAAAIRALTL